MKKTLKPQKSETVLGLQKYRVSHVVGFWVPSLQAMCLKLLITPCIVLLF